MKKKKKKKSLSNHLEKTFFKSDDKLTLHDLAEKYGVSAERIRQLEKAAMDKIKTHMQA